jgi:hypothetical protein
MLDDALREAGIALSAIVLIAVPDGVMVERISRRVTCPRGHVPRARRGACAGRGL